MVLMVADVSVVVMTVSAVAGAELVVVEAK